MKASLNFSDQINHAIKKNIKNQDIDIIMLFFW